MTYSTRGDSILSVHGGVMFELERESAPIGEYDDWIVLMNWNDHRLHTCGSLPSHTVTKKETQREIIRSNANPWRPRLVSHLQWRPPHTPSPSGPIQLVMWQLFWSGTSYLLARFPNKEEHGQPATCMRGRSGKVLARASPPTISSVSVSSRM